MRRLHKYIIVLTTICSLATLLSCMKEGVSNDNDKDKYSEQLTRFVLYSEIINHPEMLVLPYEGDSVMANTDITIIFNRPVNKNADWNVTVDSVVYNKSSPEISWASLSMGDYEYPVLNIHPQKPFMRGKTISLVADGFTTDNGLIRFEKTVSTFDVYYYSLSISVTPSNYATMIAPDQNVVLTFSEPIDQTTNWNVTIDGIVYAKFSPGILWDEQQKVLTINPAGYFQRSKTITVYASGFASSFDGYPFPATISRFTTMSGASAAVKPANGEKAVRVDANIVITFSEAMVPDDSWSVATGGVTYTKDSPGISWSDAKNLTIIKASNFAPLSTVTIGLQRFHAEFDNSLFSGPSMVAFKTGLRAESIPMNNAISSQSHLSSAIDSNGISYVGYYDINNQYPVYMTNKGGSWQNYPIDTEKYVGHYPAIAIDLTDSLMAAYTDYGGSVFTFAKEEDGSWNKHIFGPGYYQEDSVSITTDSLNAVHLSYWMEYALEYTLMYVNNNDGSWAIETIDPDLEYGGYNSSIAADSNNKIHISYCGGDNLRYATNVDGSWKTYILDSVRYSGYSSVIAIDSNNAVHIAYYYDTSDFNNQCIRYATNKSGTWQRYQVDKVFYTGNDISICIDSHDAVYIGYMDFVQSDYKSYVKVASLKSSTWSIMYADSDERMGFNVTMKIDSKDYLHIFYECGLQNGVLRHATTAP